jgi:pseudouridine kinase
MIACIGGAHIDRRGVLRGPAIVGTSNSGDVRVDFGGVARNVAHNLARLGCAVTLLSRIGDDDSGRLVASHTAAAGIDVSLFTISAAHATASYTAILEPNGELVIGLADMDIYDELTPALLARALPRLREHDFWFVESNVPGPTIDWLLEQAGDIPVAVDAISIAPSRRLQPLLPRVSVLFCNLTQAVILAGLDDPRPRLADAARALQAAGARAGVVSAGPRGIAVWNGEDVQAFPAFPATPRDVTGAGDALVSGTLFGLSRGQSLQEAARLGLAAAAVTVESEFAAHPHLTFELLDSLCG